MREQITHQIRMMKRIVSLYYDSRAMHIAVLSLVITAILPSNWRITHAVGVGLMVLATERFMRRLPHLFTEADIPEWYRWGVTLYWGVVAMYYLTADIVEYVHFTFNILPIVAIPITILSMIVVLQNEGLQSEEYEVP